MARKSEGGERRLPVIQNRRARHDYEILNTHEGGIVLVGSEVKSVLAGKVNLQGSHCRVESGEIWIYDMDIAPYEKAASFVPERRRKRKLLFHKKQIELLRRRSEERGLSLIPTKVYFANGKVKVEVALAKGRKMYDKREAIAKKDERRARQREG
jgi:SsrA-binding protein